MFKKILIIASMMASATTAHAMDSGVLSRIQEDANSQLTYKLDRAGKDIWKIPTKSGDCEDYALLKRQMLINAGWNENDIQILLLAQSQDDGKKKIMIGHVVLYIPSQNVILDMPRQGKYAAPQPIINKDEFLKKENFIEICKIADISSNEYPTVSERCEKKKK